MEGIFLLLHAVDVNFRFQSGIEIIIEDGYETRVFIEKGLYISLDEFCICLREFILWKLQFYHWTILEN